MSSAEQEGSERAKVEQEPWNTVFAAGWPWPVMGEDPPGVVLGEGESGRGVTGFCVSAAVPGLGKGLGSVVPHALCLLKTDPYLFSARW